MCFVVCSAGYGGDGTTCTVCTGTTYKSDIANTDCLETPPESTVPDGMVINGGNTDFCKLCPCHPHLHFHIVIKFLVIKLTICVLCENKPLLSYSSRKYNHFTSRNNLLEQCHLMGNTQITAESSITFFTL